MERRSEELMEHCVEHLYAGKHEHAVNEQKHEERKRNAIVACDLGVRKMMIPDCLLEVLKVLLPVEDD